MSLLTSIVLFAIGLVVVIFCAERLVAAAVGTSIGFGVSPFVISVVFIGFDPENLAVGASGAYEGVAGIALGSIIGAAMVAIALAFGVTALIVPMVFEQVPLGVLAVPVLTVAVFTGLAWDGTLSRVDGGILLLAFVVALFTLVSMSRRGADLRPGGEVAETLEREAPRGRWTSLGLLVASLVGIVVGSELLVNASEVIIVRLGLSETVFGMTILAFVVSVEEIARELPAAWKGRPEISYGNVVGSILAFFGFNAGLIALVRPIDVETRVLRFYLPVCALTVAVTSLTMSTKTVSRWAGGLLVALYVVFVIGGALT